MLRRGFRIPAIHEQCSIWGGERGFAEQELPFDGGEPL
jgi:hypothetical protein